MAPPRGFRVRIGILGGTFDPPHAGHLEFARAAREALKLDEIIFLPANRNPLKSNRSASPKDRLEMTRLMLRDEPDMAVSDIEITRGGRSYAVDTLGELKHARPADYWFLVGADALRDLDRWKDPDRLLRLCRLGVALRPPTTESSVMARLDDERKKRVDLVPMKPIDISSTEIRDRLASGVGVVAPFVSPAVLQYIKQNRLYGS